MTAKGIEELQADIASVIQANDKLRDDVQRSWSGTQLPAQGVDLVAVSNELRVAQDSLDRAQALLQLHKPQGPSDEDVAEAVRRLQAELTQNGPAIEAVLNEFDES